MQRNPAAVAEKAKTDPELKEFLTEFTGVCVCVCVIFSSFFQNVPCQFQLMRECCGGTSGLMGSHFEKIGKQQDPEAAAREVSQLKPRFISCVFDAPHSQLICTLSINVRRRKELLRRRLQYVARLRFLCLPRNCNS